MPKLLDRLTLTAFCLLGGALAAVLITRALDRVDVVPVVRAQSSPAPGMKTVIVNGTRRLDPLKVVRIMEAGAEVAPSVPSQYHRQWLVRNDLTVKTTKEFRVAYNLPANDDTWLEKLSLVLRNRTSKSIVFVSVGVSFPETKASGPMLWPFVRFGQLPSNTAFYGTGAPIPPRVEKPFLLAPGDETSFPFIDHAEHLKEVVERRQALSSVSMCYLHFLVSFEDGTHWSEGGYAAPDPFRPGRFIPFETTYFPGPLVGPSAD